MAQALRIFECRCVREVPVSLQDLFLRLLTDLLRQLQCLDSLATGFGMDV